MKRSETYRKIADYLYKIRDEIAEVLRAAANDDFIPLFMTLQVVVIDKDQPVAITRGWIHGDNLEVTEEVLKALTETARMVALKVYIDEYKRKEGGGDVP